MLLNLLFVAQKFNLPKKFPYLENIDYMRAFMVPLVYNKPESKIISVQVTSNSGFKPNNGYELAFDNNQETYWESKKQLTKGKKCEFNISFSGPITFKSIVYQGKTNSEVGWPMEFIVYGKKEISGAEFVLFEGKMNQNPEMAIEMVLNEEVTISYLSFIIVKNKGYYGSISTLAFLRADTTREKVNTLFTDGTWSELTDPNINLESLKTEISTHVLQSEFEFPIRIATDVKADPEAAKSSVYTLRCADPGYQYSLKKTGQHFTPLQATGKIIHYGEKVDVFCENYDNEVEASITFCKTYDSNKEGFQTIPLPTGHSVKEPKEKFIGAQFAFVLFMCKGNFGEQVKQYPRVRFVGGMNVPHYEKGMDVVKFKEDLKAYLSDKDFTNDLGALTGKPNVIELCAKDVIITDNATVVLNQMEKDEPNGYTLDMVLEKWEEIIPLYNKYSGFDINDPLPCHKPVLGTVLIKICLQEDKPFAWSDFMYTYFSKSHLPKLVSYVSFTTDGWGFYHEWGHNFDNRDLKITETTNNLYSLMMERHVKFSSNLDRRNCWSTTGNFINGINYEMSVFVKLAILRQMEIFAGEDTVAKMNRMSREGFFDQYSKNEEDRFSRWAIGLSKITGYNCAEHFEKHGITMTQECKDYTKDLKPLPIKTWLITERVYNYKGTGIPKDSKPVVNFVYNKDGNIQLSLSMSHDKEDTFSDILGYEIRDENGATVGWTYTNQWTSTHKDFFNKDVKYYIYAIGLNMKDSEPTVFEWNAKKEVEVDGKDFIASPFPADLKEETKNGGYPISGVLDRKPNTCYFTRPYKGSGTIGVTFDFNNNVSFTGFLHQNSLETITNGRTKGFKISISQDNEKWDTILSGGNITIPDADLSVTRKIYFNKKYTARYLRFEQLEDTEKSNRIALCDFALLNIEKGSNDPSDLGGGNADDGTNAGVIAACSAIAVIVVVVVVVIAILLIIKRKKQNKDISTEIEEVI